RSSINLHSGSSFLKYLKRSTAALARSQLLIKTKVPVRNHRKPTTETQYTALKFLLERKGNTMTPKKLMTILALALACAAPLLYSQGPGNPPDPATRAQHHIQMLTKVLNLTPAQQQQATTIFNNTITGESSFHDSMKTAHQSLQTAIKNNDAAGID